MNTSNTPTQLDLRIFFKKHLDDYVQDMCYYNDEDEAVDCLVALYEEAKKHIGFKDKRKDKRYIVKFHDIFYYTPAEFTDTDEFNNLFERFCMYESEAIQDDIKNTLGRDVLDESDDVLDSYTTGHYHNFRHHIDSITNDNILDVVRGLTERFNAYEAIQYLRDYTYIVYLLQNLENNYMLDWLQELQDNDNIPAYVYGETKQNYIDGLVHSVKTNLHNNNQTFINQLEGVKKWKN